MNAERVKLTAYPSERGGWVVSRDRIIALVEEAERAFAGQPKALWSDRTYLAPKDARALRAFVSETAPASPESLSTTQEDPNSFSIPSDRLDVEKLARVIDRFAMDTGFDAEGRAKAIKAAQAIRSFILGEG